MVQKVVINNCFGGFGLSDEAYEFLSTKYKIPMIKYERGQDPDGKVIFDRVLNGEKGIAGRYWCSWLGGDEIRSDPMIISVVEELGEAANGFCSRLKIVEVPDGVNWEIDEYDGNETIDEVHRSWS